MTSVNVESSALIESNVELGPRTRVWHLSHIRSGVSIGADCIIGRNVYVGSGVVIGNSCKIQNNACVYEPSELGDGVFIGPGAILTNDVYPRAVNADMTLKTQRDWSLEKVKILTGASIGAGSICVAPVKIGRWAIVAAGAVVIEDVKDFALVAGVPAKQIGWVGKSGYRLIEDKEHFWCPLTKEKFVIKNGILEELLTP